MIKIVSKALHIFLIRLFHFVLSKHCAKMLIYWPFLFFASCKDFQSWDSKYTCKVLIKFESDKDPLAPQTLKSLQSALIEDRQFIKLPIYDTGQNDTINDPVSQGKPFQLRKMDSFPLNLRPDTDFVSFEVRSMDGLYYQKVTIHYKRNISLISPDAGGLQIQYVIKSIELTTQPNKKNIVHRFAIEAAIPLKENTTNANITLYY